MVFAPFLVFSSEADILSFDALFFVVMATAYSLFYIAVIRIIKNSSNSSPGNIALRLKLHLLLNQPDIEGLHLDLAENTEVNRVYMEYMNGSLIRNHIEGSREVEKMLTVVVPLLLVYYAKVSFDGALSVKSCLLLGLVIIDLLFLRFEIAHEFKLRKAELERAIRFIEDHSTPAHAKGNMNANRSV